MFKTFLQYKTRLFLSILLLNSAFAFAQKPVLNLTTIAYIEQKTVDYYGGIAAIQDSIKLQFKQVNAAYNADARFAHTYNFNVLAFHVYQNTNPNVDSSTYFKLTKPAETAYDYRVIYDGFPKNDSSTAFNYTESVNFFYSQRNFKNGNMFSKMATKAMQHEFGHSRGQLDLYATNVPGGSNPVNQNYSYNSDYSSVMDDLYNDSQWDPISIAILNQTGNTYGSSVVPIDQIRFIQRSLFPQNMYIRVKDANGVAVQNAQVTLYGTPFYGNAIDPTAVATYNTDASGLVSFIGSANNPFNPSAEPYWLSKYANFFVKLTYGTQTKYGWLNSVEALNTVATGSISTPYYLDMAVAAGTTQPANIAPVTNFDIAGGLTIPVGQTTYLVASPRDIDGDPSQLTVKFYSGSTYIGLGTFEQGGLRYSYTFAPNTVGEFSYYATVTDPQGATVTSITARLRVVSNEAITALAISSPANGTSVSAGTAVTLKSSFSDVAATINKIEYYDNGTLIGSSYTIPYSFTWTPATAGTHSITSIAYDSYNLSKTSAAITVTVTAAAGCPDPQYVAGTTYATGAKVKNNGHEYQCTVGGWCSSASASYYAPGTGSAWTSAWNDLGACSGTNQAPTVTLTAPTNNATYSAPATVTLTATAADADGTISKVEFYRGGTTLIATVTTSPYTYSWTSVAAGSYSITAKAYDNSNATTTSTAAAITVTAANQAPTVTLTAPTNNATYSAPATVTLTATAADADGTISKVEFYRGGTTLIATVTTSPYTYSWTSVAAGSYSITAKAYDNSNATTTSTAAAITVTAANQAPTVTLTAPTNNATYSAPATVTLTATAADADGTISKVEFYRGGTTLIATVTTSPYTYSWTSVAAGSYSITAKAYDNSNATTTSTAAAITVTAANQAPTVSLTAPTNNATYSAPATVTLTATAADADGTISKVEFYRGGTTLIATVTTSPYTYSWTSVAAGSYSITAKAYDNSNATTTSTAAAITVTASGGTCTAQLWSATATYGTTGTAVQYNGIKYTSNFWTSGDQPDLHNGGNGSGQPWTSQGTCTSRIGEESTIAPALAVYPNPSNGSFTIIAAENTSATVINTFGNNVADLSLAEGKNEVNLPLASGIYFVKFKDSVIKLVIE